MKLATKLVARPTTVSGEVEPLTLPLYETTTFVFDTAEQVKEYNEGRSGRYLYARYGGPSTAAVEGTLADLDGAERALLFASGQAATSAALLGLLQAGDEVVCSGAAYGGTVHLMADVLSKFGIVTRFARVADFETPGALLSARTKVLWFESPVNPTLRCVDVRAVAAACRARGVISILDNTFASPLNQQPLALGVDIAMQSATKYLNGHTDLLGGVLAGPAALLDRIESARRMVGGILDARAAHALGRGLKTLALRVARQNASAAAIAAWLDGSGRVERVYYPGLPGHPDHHVARGQMSGFGGMVCLELGSYERAAAFFDRLQVFQRAASLGGVESLCSLPVLTSHWGHSPEALRNAGVTPGMARLSVGLEDAEDLIADLDRALA